MSHTVNDRRKSFNKLEATSIFSYRKLYEQPDEMKMENNPIFSTAVFCIEQKKHNFSPAKQQIKSLFSCKKLNQQRITKQKQTNYSY